MIKTRLIVPFLIMSGSIAIAQTAYAKQTEVYDIIEANIKNAEDGPRKISFRDKKTSVYAELIGHLVMAGKENRIPPLVNALALSSDEFASLIVDKAAAEFAAKNQPVAANYLWQLTNHKEPVFEDIYTDIVNGLLSMKLPEQALSYIQDNLKLLNNNLVYFIDYYKNEPEKAEAFYNQYADTLTPSLNQVSLFLTLGEGFRIAGQKQKAVFYLDKAEAMLTQNRNQRLATPFKEPLGHYRQLAYFYALNGEKEKSLGVINNAIAHFENENVLKKDLEEVDSQNVLAAFRVYKNVYSKKQLDEKISQYQAVLKNVLADESRFEHYDIKFETAMARILSVADEKEALQKQTEAYSRLACDDEPDCFKVKLDALSSTKSVLKPKEWETALSALFEEMKKSYFYNTVASSAVSYLYERASDPGKLSEADEIVDYGRTHYALFAERMSYSDAKPVAEALINSGHYQKAAEAINAFARESDIPSLMKKVYLAQGDNEKLRTIVKQPGYDFAYEDYVVLIEKGCEQYTPDCVSYITDALNYIKAEGELQENIYDVNALLYAIGTVYSTFKKVPDKQQQALIEAIFKQAR